jgi:hypothetical protein
MLSTTERRGLSLARGFIVLIMPAVHTTLLYSTTEVKQGLIGFLLGFLAEQPGAQLFMFLMGVFIAYGRKKTFNEVVQRVFYLFIAAYVLNFMRLVLPYYLGWLPTEFLSSNKVVIDQFTSIRLLLTGDILQLAAISYFICQCFMRVKGQRFALLSVVLLLVFLSPLSWQLQATDILLQLPLALFNGLPPTTFFPVFPWLCYSMAGMLVGLCWQNYSAAIKNIIWIISSALMMITGFVLICFEPVDWTTNFYRLGPGGTLIHLGAVLVWIALFVWAAQKKPDAIFFHFLNWLSKHITIIYFTQWILIMWLLPVFGFEQLSFISTLSAILLSSTMSFLIPALYQKFIHPRKSVAHE